VIAPKLLHNVILVTAIGLLWFLVVVGMVIFGVRATAQMQKVVTYVQIGGLGFFGIGAVIKGLAHPANHPGWSWWSPSGNAGLHGFIAGALVTMFFYWGWEVSANLSEETIDRNRAPGLAGLLGMGIILALFLLTVAGAQLQMSTKAIADSGSDLLVALANTVLPRPWGDVAIIVVIVSAVGALETSLVAASRTVYSMGRDAVLDRRLGYLNPRFLTPWNATIAIGLVSMVLFGFAATSTNVNQILSDSINAIGVEIAIFYGLSAVACAVHYRWWWPLLPALFVFGVAIGQVASAGARANATVFGLLLAGTIPMMIYRHKYRSAYYRSAKASPQ
jgi:amino acid transporter